MWDDRHVVALNTVLFSFLSSHIFCYVFNFILRYKGRLQWHLRQCIQKWTIKILSLPSANFTWPILEYIYPFTTLWIKLRLKLLCSLFDLSITAIYNVFLLQAALHDFARLTLSTKLSGIDFTLKKQLSPYMDHCRD